MSLIIKSYNNSIVDRDHEAGQIARIIEMQSETKGSSVILLYADSGFGKSSVVEKVKEKYQSLKDRMIIVNTPPKNRTSASVEGNYLNCIAEAINQKLLGVFTLEDFLDSPEGDMQRMIDVDEILKNGSTFTSALTSGIGQLALAELKAQRLLYDSTIDSILVIKKYIELAIARYDIILDITNAQNMDTATYRVLNSILQTPSMKTIILEYTTEDGNFLDAIKFAESFNCSCELMKIDCLPFEFALSILGIPVDSQKISEIEKFYNNVVKGNLYKLIQEKLNAKSYGDNYSEDPIDKRIRLLGYAQKLILSIVCLHDGEIATNLLNEILESINSSFYIPVNWRLELDSLLEEEDGILKLHHPSIADSISLAPDNAITSSAYLYLVSFYEKWLNEGNTADIHKVSVIMLIKLHSQFNPIKMLPLMTQFKQIIIGSIAERDALRLIKQAFDSINVGRETRYHLILISLCYDAGFYTSAYSLMKELEPLSLDSSKILMCMLLNRNDYHEDAIMMCDDIYRRTTHTRYKLISLMIKMLSQRSLNLTNEYRKTFRKIKRNLQFRNLPEYGFFLRNAQITLTYAKGLDYIQRSISFFERKGEPLFAAQAKLTLAVQNARLGNLEESERILDSIAPIIISESFEKHIIYINRAAVRLLGLKADDVTDSLLNKALLTVTTVFDRISVLNCMLCSIIIRSGTIDEFERICKMIEKELILEPDQRIRKKVYTNIYLYHRDVSKNHEKAHYWKAKALEIKAQDKRQMLEYIILTNSRPREDLRFLASKNFCVSFITYWHFSIPLLDE